MATVNKGLHTIRERIWSRYKKTLEERVYSYSNQTVRSNNAHTRGVSVRNRFTYAIYWELNGQNGGTLDQHLDINMHTVWRRGEKEPRVWRTRNISPKQLRIIDMLQSSA